MLPRFIWDGIKYVLRWRHRLKLALFHPFIIESGDLRQTIPTGHSHQFGEVDRLVLSNASAAAHSTEGTYRASCGSFERQPPYLCEVVDAHLVGTFAAPLTAGRRIVAENMYGRRNVTLCLRPGQILAGSLGREDIVFDRALSLLHPYCHNYYHWFTDCLVQLEALEEYQKWRGSTCDVLVPSFLFPWQSASLELLGYPADKLRPFTYKHARAKTLLVPSARRFEDDLLTPSGCKWVRDRLLTATSHERPGSTFSRRIFVSRRGAAKGPRIQNEETLAKALATMGFETCVPGTMTLPDQISLFRQAEVIVGVHGAAFTNLIFSTCPTVVEIFPETVSRRDYRAIAEIVGARYYRLAATRGSSHDGGDFLAPEHLLGLLQSLDL